MGGALLVPAGWVPAGSVGAAARWAGPPVARSLARPLGRPLGRSLASRGDTKWRLNDAYHVQRPNHI